MANATLVAENIRLQDEATTHTRVLEEKEQEVVDSEQEIICLLQLSLRNQAPLFIQGVFVDVILDRSSQQRAS